MRNLLSVALALVLGACTLDQTGAGAKGQDAGNSGGFGGAAGMAGGGGFGGSGGSSGSSGSGGSGGSGGLGCFPGPGQKVCGAQCVDIDDPDFGCTDTSCTACSPRNATAHCAGGACAILRCNDGFEDCEGGAFDGCETNINDPRRCGGCNTDCFADTSAENWTCANGTCEVSECPLGLGDCNEDSSDGCETDTNVTPAHCGFCRNQCDLPNATAKCTAAKCEIDRCNPGYADCDGNPANGCEVFTREEADNCGACGHVCSGTGVDTRTCQEGVCRPVCHTGRGDCGTPVAPTPDDGCEVDLNTTLGHCGGCNRSCQGGPHVQTRRCEVGLCKPVCVRGRGDCSSPPAPAQDNGCETDTDTTVGHCGACGRGCDEAHATTRACSDGLCTSSCEAGYSNCSRPPAPGADDGCELPTSTDPDNCGGCGTVCSGTEVDARSCVGGLCSPKCKPGRLDCNSATANDGCEGDATDAATCGSCSNSCSAAQTCTAGSCVGSGGTSGTGGGGSGGSGGSGAGGSGAGGSGAGGSGAGGPGGGSGGGGGSGASGG